MQFLHVCLDAILSSSPAGNRCTRARGQSFPPGGQRAGKVCPPRAVTASLLSAETARDSIDYLSTTLTTLRSLSSFSIAPEFQVDPGSNHNADEAMASYAFRGPPGLWNGI